MTRTLSGILVRTKTNRGRCLENSRYSPKRTTRDRIGDLAAQKSHRKIAVTTVAASKLAAARSHSAAEILVTRPKYPHHETVVAIPLSQCVPVLSQTIAATPPLLSVKMAYRNPRPHKGVSQTNSPLKPIAPEGASHEIVSPIAL